MDVECPNEECTLFGIAGKGNVACYGTCMSKSGKIRKYICHHYGTRFCDRMKTAFYDLRTSENKVQLALEMATKGMSVNGIADVLKAKPSTIRDWISRGSEHCEKVSKANPQQVD